MEKDYENYIINRWAQETDNELAELRRLLSEKDNQIEELQDQIDDLKRNIETLTSITKGLMAKVLAHDFVSKLGD